MTEKDRHLDLLKMIWGFILLGLIGYLAHAFAVGIVEEKTSFGLPALLVALALFADRFTTWAFVGKSKTEQPSPPKGASD